MNNHDHDMNTLFSMPLQRIADKLQALRRADPEEELFGAEAHHYRAAPALSEEALRQVEAAYGVTLPEEYAVFLTHIGNGGVGPGYGLQRFGHVKAVAEIPVASPRGPMKVVHKTRDWTISRQDLFNAEGELVDPFDVAFFSSIERLAPDGQDGPGVLLQPFPLQAPSHGDDLDGDEAPFDPAFGTLMLADYGCGMEARLVLDGPFRSQVWLHLPDCDGFVPFAEMANLHHVETDTEAAETAQTFTFLSWFEHWLDHALVEACQNAETNTNTETN